ncbi:tyrosine/dopa decarboxylase 1 [Quercus suber]|uniref:Tyrosine/dopa decarboxylase 1 n=1 Tax=Quercus suber TaxID=58331 RepID=A0AAW0M4N5_QUESU
MLIDFIADYYQNIESYKVLSQVEPGYLKKLLPESAPYYPESIETILQDVQKYIIPGITHWQSPNYFAYFPSSGSTAGFLGEILSTGFNVVGFNWMSSPAATELECIVMDWLGEMLMLPKSFLFKVHYKRQLKLLESTQRTSEPSKLRSQIHLGMPKLSKDAVHADVEAGLVPFFLCATVGTTSTNAIDPIGPLCEVAKDFNIWVHVDAAYAGSACICPEFRHFIDGIEGANSVFEKQGHRFKTSGGLQRLANNLEPKIPSLKLWLVLRSYGVANLRNFLRSHVKMAKLFEELLAYHVERVNELNKKLLESINESGNMYMSSTVLMEHT